MLRSLSVRELVVIPKLDIEFAPGLTVITGESGVGKSVLLEALALALGGRAASDRIRPGAERAEARAEIEAPAGGEAARFIEERELVDEDAPDTVLLRRALDRGGRSRAFVNDRPVTRQVLAAFGAIAVDIHAQDANTRLDARTEQQRLLDDFCLDDGQRDGLATAWRARREARETLEAFEAESPMGEERRSLVAYQLEELATLDPRAEEVAEIETEHGRLARVDTLQEGAAKALEGFGVVDALGATARAMEDLGDPDSDLEAAGEAIDSALSLLGDAERSLRSYAERLEADPERFAVLDGRLSLYQDIARKHRVAPEELANVRERLAAELAGQEGREERHRHLSAQVQERDAAWRKLAKAADTSRRRAAPKFAKRVQERMRALGIAGGGFTVAFAEDLWEGGLETAGFLVQTHADHPPQPLGRVASGGERARISLAIALVAAESSALPCLVLDEADIGVGGVTADTVGRALRDLARSTQVICVTHAPQVAALGDGHFRVARGAEGETVVESLEGKERVEEVARMLAGANVTAKARAHARDLLDGRLDG